MTTSAVASPCLRGAQRPAEAPGAAPADALPAPPGEGAPLPPPRPGRPLAACSRDRARRVARRRGALRLPLLLALCADGPAAHPRRREPRGPSGPSTLALFGPVRRHFLPLLDDAPQTASRKAPSRAAAGLDLPSDLREIVVASTSPMSWVALVGGRVPKGRFVSGMEKVARDEGWTPLRHEGRAPPRPGRAVLGQADDGTLVLGTDARDRRAALPPSDEWRRLDLPEQGAVTFALTSAACPRAAAVFGVLPRAGALFRRIDHASGRARARRGARALDAPRARVGRAAAVLAPDTRRSSAA